MKRIVAILLLLCMLFACQPTPEKDAVKQKNTNVLIDTVRVAEQEQQSTGAALPPVKEQFPERFQCDFMTSAQNVHVVADVPLEVLTDGTFPTLRVERRTLTGKERLTLAQRLLDSESLYIFEENVTREDVAEWIAIYMQEPSPEDKAEWMREEHGTEAEWQEMMDRRTGMAAELQQRYNELPVDDARVPLVPWDGSVPPYDEYGVNRYWIVSEPTSEGYWWTRNIVEVCANPLDRGIEYRMARMDEYDVTYVSFFDLSRKTAEDRIDPEDYDTPHEGASVTPNDAARLVQSYFGGFGEFAIADVCWANNAATDDDVKGIRDNTRWAYLLHMTPVRGGAYAPYCGSSASDDDPEADVQPVWCYESLTAAVDGSGNLISLIWQSPLKVTNTISQSSPLLPYAEIQMLFETQMNRNLAYEMAKDAVVTVNAVQLGLFRIRERDDLNSGLLVPVWYFTGTIAYEHEGTDYKNGLSPLLIINAVDGSIIDPEKGY